MLRDYNNFQQAENPFVVDVFATSNRFPATPLLQLSVLRLLIDRAAEDSSGDRYVSLPQASLYFSAMGVSDDALREALSKLLDFGLVEPFDTSHYSLSSDQRLSITHSGRMHVEMAVSDPVYVSEMAYASPIRAPAIVDHLRTMKSGAMDLRKWQEARRLFIGHCLEQDRLLAQVPSDEIFKGQVQLRIDLTRWSIDADAEEETRAPNVDHAYSHRSGSIKWFNRTKGFGFIEAGLQEDVFIHASTLERSGIGIIDSGDEVICDIVTGTAGRLQAIQVHSISRQPGKDGMRKDRQNAEVLFFNDSKGYGFLKVEGLEEDVYVSASVVRKAGLKGVVAGQRLFAQIGADVPGRGRAAMDVSLAEG